MVLMPRGLPPRRARTPAGQPPRTAALRRNLGTNLPRLAYLSVLTDSERLRPNIQMGDKVMKTQAWGWLVAGVLALGLNGIYQDGGAEWLHRNVDGVIARIADRSEGVLALAAGRADWLLAKANLAAARKETTSCRVASAMARVQSKMARSQERFADFEAMSAREEAALARVEANRARIEAQVARVRFSPVGFDGVKIRTICPRVRVNVPRVNIPRIPAIHIPDSDVHEEVMNPEPI